MGMFCVPDPLKSQILGYPKSQILGYSLVFPNPRSSVTGSCLRNGQVLCPRSSVTGSCLRNGHVLCPRSSVTGSCLRNEHVLCPRSSVTGSCLRNGHVLCPRSSVTGSCLRNGNVLECVCVSLSQILGNWELPQKWSLFQSECFQIPGNWELPQTCSIYLGKVQATCLFLGLGCHPKNLDRQLRVAWCHGGSIYFWDNMPENELM